MRKIYRRTLVLVGIVICLLFAASFEAMAGEAELPFYKLRLSSEYPPENHQTVALYDAAAKISELTDGHVTITVYPNLQLGDYTVVYGQVMTGDIDITASPISPTYDQRIEILNLPYLASDFNEFRKNFFPGSFIWDLTSDINEKNGTTLLGIFNAGFMGIGSTSFPSEAFAELTDGNIQKDVLLRTPASRVFVEIVSAMGYRTTTIPYAELYSALQAGVADGWIGGSALVNWDGFRDVIKCFLDANAVNECIPISINTKLLKSMPEDYQKVITSTFLEMANRVADERQQQEEQAVANMKEFNIKVIEPTDEELAALRDRIREVVWNKMRDSLGDPLIDTLCDAYGVPKL